jgi:hypothetical protein
MITLSPICFALMTPNWVIIISLLFVTGFVWWHRQTKERLYQIRDFGANGQVDTNCPSAPPQTILSLFKIKSPKNLHLLPETAHVSSVSQVERIHTDRTLDLGISREVELLFKV